MLIRHGLRPARVQTSPTKVQTATVDLSAMLRSRSATVTGCDSGRPPKDLGVGAMWQWSGYASAMLFKRRAARRHILNARYRVTN